MSAATQVPIELQSISFKPVRRAFVLHNARQRPIEVLYAGNLMTLPARHEIHPIKTETDDEGNPIPGTYVIEDVYTYVPSLGDEICTLDAARAVTHILGLQRRADGTLSDAQGSHARAGISFLPRHPSKSVWQQIAQEGDKRVFLRDVESARILVTDVQKRNNDLRAGGLTPVVIDPAEWQRSVFLLEKYAELTKRTFDVGDGVKPFEEEALTDELEFDVFMKAKVMEIASKAAEATAVDKVELFKQLLEDPKVRMQVQKIYKIQRKGHMPLKDKDLEKAAAAGKTTVEAGLETRSPVEDLGVPAADPAPTPESAE